MSLLRCILASGAAACLSPIAAPASAQFFLSPHEMTGTPVRGNEPGMGAALPGATEAELRAALVWNMRAALNVAALQCQFEPTLLTQPNYNAVLFNHKDELKKSYDTLTKYFLRMNKAAKVGQNALDQFGTRTYSGFTTVAAQFGFCQTAASIARDAVFFPRGSFYKIAEARTRELRNSLVPYSDERVPQPIVMDHQAMLPRLDDDCWKNGSWNAKKCDALELSAQ